jgi:hypothetical protein
MENVATSALEVHQVGCLSTSKACWRKGVSQVYLIVVGWWLGFDGENIVRRGLSDLEGFRFDWPPCLFFC